MEPGSIFNLQFAEFSRYKVGHELSSYGLNSPFALFTFEKKRTFMKKIAKIVNKAGYDPLKIADPVDFKGSIIFYR